jgi:L-cysteine:1D-myo-inositol 2-amino-2-deoxy-alpha-D-glucopyranoside ligase
MRLYDTARQAVVPTEPRDGRVGLYVCGITPYDAAHLGHAFTYHVFDVITRRLIDAGLNVRSVRNVTDVDDDILRVAGERGADYRVLGEDQMRRFDRDMARIHLRPVDAAPRATAHVSAMVQWIRQLEREGFAYVREGWVYFDSAAYPKYGALSGLDNSRMLALSRQRGGNPDDPRKRHPLDFVLWQPSLPDEPQWPSPWSDGRPGWHIECSVLASDDPGAPVDIHGGGDDLIFPHHECELAQAEAAGVTPFVRHWVHVGMVHHEGEKMSKSLGNLIFVHDVVEDFSAAAVRLLLASHHYRASWTYDRDELRMAEARHARYNDALREGSSLDGDEAAEYQRRFRQCLDDDLDTPSALRVVDDAVTALNRRRARGAESGVRGDEMLISMLDLLGVEVALQRAGATSN